MKKNLLILVTLVFAFQLAAQRKSNFNTIDRKAGLFNNAYKNTYSASITYGTLIFGGNLDLPTDEQSNTKNITINKQVNARLTLSTKISVGELYGQGEIYNGEFQFTTNNEFSNSFLAYSLLIKKQLNGKKESKSKTFKINAATGLGIISSEVNLHPDYFAIPDSQLNFKTLYIPISFDFEYFLTPNFGFTIATELCYCFSDQMDLHGVNNPTSTPDYFTGIQLVFV
jgi:hypothetical protein